MAILSSKKGSVWRKWDLHVHTPKSINNDYGGDTDDAWEKFISDLEKLPDDFKVIGINDYLFLDGYEKVLQFKKNGRLPNIDLILPVLEFRSEELVGVEFESCQRPNIHVIFADEASLPIQNIKTQFLPKLQIMAKLESGERGTFTEILNIDSLRKFGEKIISSAPESEKSKYGSPEQEGFNNFNVSLEKICEYLNVPLFKGKYLIAIGKTEWDKLKWTNGSIASKKKLINLCDVVFTSAYTEEAFHLAKSKLKEQEVNSLLLDCSDAHTYSTTLDSDKKPVKDRIGKCYSWIKADTTFEGLKQILYEKDEERLCISENHPQFPVNAIDSIELKFPDTTETEDGKFCFAGISQLIELSPYLNCIVGGRGSGKSTLLNLLGVYAIDANSSNTFWEKYKPNFAPKDKNLFTFTGTEIFEFLGQSEVEIFARNKRDFTNAIYNRANGIGKVLQPHEDIISECEKSIERIISYIEDIKGLSRQIETKEKEKRSLITVNSIVESQQYLEITGKISKIAKIVQDHRNWIKEIDLLKSQLEDTLSYYSDDIKQSTIENDTSKKFKAIYDTAVGHIKAAINSLNSSTTDPLKKATTEVLSQLALEEQSLKDYLKSYNFSKEDIEQISHSPQQIAVLEEEIEALKISKQKITEKILGKDDDISISSVSEKLGENKTNYEQKIQDALEPLRTLLEHQFDENKGRDIKKIGLGYAFDYEKAWEDFSTILYEHFKQIYGDSEKSSDVIEFIVTNKELFLLNDANQILSGIQKMHKDEIKYVKFLEKIIENEWDFIIFKLLREITLNNVTKYKIIEVTYDGKSIEQASFGQRCTAVVVILVLFGTYPLLIDEPEAHLDSSLIANYLVPLIKIKKQNRQIIFATHNANFVINGDAEKIIILKNQSGTTQIDEATIEDLSFREDLLKLEGGKEAFESRGRKLSIIS